MKKLFAAVVITSLLATALSSYDYSPNKKPRLLLLKKKQGQHYKKRIVIRDGKRRVLVKVKKRKLKREYTPEQPKELSVLYTPVYVEPLSLDSNDSVKTVDTNQTLSDINTTISDSNSSVTPPEITE